MTFLSHGVKCKGWLYWPEGDGEVRPAIVLSHGLSGTHCIHYWRVAETLAQAGYGVLDFDPRCVGGSDGEPRQRWSPAGLREDLQAAVDHLRTLPGVDKSRIGIYGSSTGGGAAIEVAAQDGGIAALVCVVPHVDGLSNFPGLSWKRKAALTKEALRDLVARVLGRDQITVPAFAPDGSGLGVVDRDGAFTTAEQEMEPGASWSADGSEYSTGETVWTNAVSPLDALKWLGYRPGRKLSQINCPTLLVSGDHDTVTPPGPQRRFARANHRVELLTGPWNHFDVFRGDRGFPEVTDRMLGFLGDTLASRQT